MSAQTCGVIIDLGGIEKDITDCANSFGVNPGTSPINFYVNNERVIEGDTLLLSGTSTNQYSIDWSGRYFDFRIEAYLHTPGGYTEVDTKLIQPDELTEAEKTAALEEYFAGDQDIELYRQALLTGDTSHLTNDQENIYFDFDDTLHNLSPVIPHILLGTYTFVFYEETICIGVNNSPSFLVHIRSLFIPTAHAQFCTPGDEVYSVTFTLAPELETPAGASNFLFLPGIQASRLYTGGIFGEQKLWEPDAIFDPDTEKMAMNEAGQSIEYVYTRDILSYIGGSETQSVYGNFEVYLDSLVEDDVIVAYDKYAYDWRYDVYDIVENGTQYEDEVKYVEQLLETLASTSKSGKVTIIGHSNGGLLGKALIDKLVSKGKEDLVDNFIMIGTPQLGTPKAIGSLLHGYDQALDFKGIPVVSEETARFVSANMPGAYGLLPGQAYYDVADESPIQFIEGIATLPFINAYGKSLIDQTALDTFILDDRNGRDDVQTVDQALVANEFILNKARVTREKLDNWAAPNNIKVYAIVGGREEYHQWFSI